MTSSAIVRRAAAENESFIVRVWRWVKATIWRVVFGQTEWHRICSPMGSHVDEQDRMVRFRTSLALSSALVSTSNAVFDFEAFPIDATLNGMTKRLKLDAKDATLISNMRSCLQRCNFVNRVYVRVHMLRDEAYNSANTKHEDMLEQLWANLKPNMRRSGGRITKEWGEIGFQGTDPMSDFRGMGVLSLIQLVHFSAKYPVEAQALSLPFPLRIVQCPGGIKPPDAMVSVLSDRHQHHRVWQLAITPMDTQNQTALTVVISFVSRFMMDLVRERLIDFKLYAHANVHASGSDDTTSEEQGLLALHELYCTIFTRFNKLWVDSNPRDVMAFPTIFQSLKEAIRRELLQRSFKY